VATVAVAVLPGTAAAKAALAALTGSYGSDMPVTLVRTYRVARSPAADFGPAQRQFSSVMSAGPYLIISTAGFADGRHRVQVAADKYLDREMSSFAGGLTLAAGHILGSRPPTPVCPGAPGC
jgi:hypothetical protein